MPDFTYEELKSLKLKQRFENRSTLWNDHYTLLTFQEVIDLIRLLNKEYPRTNNAERKVGLYIELKDYSWNIEYAGYNTADVM